MRSTRSQSAADDWMCTFSAFGAVATVMSAISCSRLNHSSCALCCGTQVPGIGAARTRRATAFSSPVKTSGPSTPRFVSSTRRPTVMNADTLGSMSTRHVARVGSAAASCSRQRSVSFTSARCSSASSSRGPTFSAQSRRSRSSRASLLSKAQMFLSSSARTLTTPVFAGFCRLQNATLHPMLRMPASSFLSGGVSTQCSSSVVRAATVSTRLTLTADTPQPPPSPPAPLPPPPPPRYARAAGGGVEPPKASRCPQHRTSCGCCSAAAAAVFGMQARAAGTGDDVKTTGERMGPSGPSGSDPDAFVDAADDVGGSGGSSAAEDTSFSCAQSISPPRSSSETIAGKLHGPGRSVCVGHRSHATCGGLNTSIEQSTPEVFETSMLNASSFSFTVTLPSCTALWSNSACGVHSCISTPTICAMHPVAMIDPLLPYPWCPLTRSTVKARWHVTDTPRLRRRRFLSRSLNARGTQFGSMYTVVPRSRASLNDGPAAFHTTPPVLMRCPPAIGCGPTPAAAAPPVPAPLAAGGAAPLDGRGEPRGKTSRDDVWLIDRASIDPLPPAGVVAPAVKTLRQVSKCRPSLCSDTPCTSHFGVSHRSIPLLFSTTHATLPRSRNPRSENTCRSRFRAGAPPPTPAPALPPPLPTAPPAPAPAPLEAAAAGATLPSFAHGPPSPPLLPAPPPPAPPDAAAAEAAGVASPPAAPAAHAPSAVLSASFGLLAPPDEPPLPPPLPPPPAAAPAEAAVPAAPSSPPGASQAPPSTAVAVATAASAHDTRRLRLCAVRAAASSSPPLYGRIASSGSDTLVAAGEADAAAVAAAAAAAVAVLVTEARPPPPPPPPPPLPLL
eukprot:Rhum_TRINITY_DN14676_c13_g3::Rhum_TRINITY_DN14676_c13_g3_i1::g.108644::m.108644